VATYLALLQQEIALARQGPPLSTVYLGGGTPSLLAPVQVEALLEALQQRFGIAPGAEITLEADPASFDRHRLLGWLAAGINRISLGGQSLDDGVLAALGRRHRRTDVVEAAAWLNAAKGRGALRSWSLDLIQGLPPFSGVTIAGATVLGATVAGARAPAEVLAHWHQQLQQALALGPPHFSVYDLIVEPGTVFARQQERGQLRLPDEDLGADLMEATAQVLRQAGYGRYEISNYALPGHASRHNRVYWSGAGWWGFGMGATSALGGKRQARPRTREQYAAWIQAGAREGELGVGEVGVGEDGDGPLGAGPPIDELLMVGLRRREGVPLRQMLGQQGLDSQAESELRLRLAAFEQRGLLRVEGGRWRLQDPEGLALSNAVLRDVLEWWQEQRPGGGVPAGC
jgi:oxygen-independent coproporphyrinogen-3 oxidase